jgi:hypothetical protein
LCELDCVTAAAVPDWAISVGAAVIRCTCDYSLLRIFAIKLAEVGKLNPEENAELCAFNICTL